MITRFYSRKKNNPCPTNAAEMNASIVWPALSELLTDERRIDPIEVRSHGVIENAVVESEFGLRWPLEVPNEQFHVVLLLSQRKPGVPGDIAFNLLDSWAAIHLHRSISPGLQKKFRRKSAAICVVNTGALYEHLVVRKTVSQRVQNGTTILSGTGHHREAQPYSDRSQHNAANSEPCHGTQTRLQEI